MEELLKNIFKDHEDFSLDSYLFILKAIEFAQNAKNDEVSTAQELWQTFALYASHEFGPMAEFTLKQIGINNANDFAKILYQLGDYNFIKIPESIQKEEFAELEKLTDLFTSQDVPERGEWPSIKKINNFQRFS